MKAAIRKRYRSVMAALNKANKDITLGKRGIMAIDALIKAV